MRLGLAARESPLCERGWSPGHSWAMSPCCLESKSVLASDRPLSGLSSPYFLVQVECEVVTL